MSAGLPGFIKKNVTFHIDDGASKTMTTGPGDGLFTFSGIQEGDHEVVEVKNRGNHLALIEGDQEPIEFSIVVTIGTATSLTDATADRILDAVRKTGNWASATSKETIGCSVWAFQIRIVMADSCGKSNTITFAKVRAKADKEMTDEGLRLTINCTAYGDGSGGPAYTIT